MLHHAHRSDDYFALRVDTYSNLTRIEPITASGKTLIVKDKLTEQIYASLERAYMDERVIEYCKSIDQYLETLSETIKKHAEGFKRQIALLKESVLPLIKVDNIFKQIYGIDVFNAIADKTLITYFPNSKKAFDGGKMGSYQLYVIETISNDISNGSISQLSKDLVTLLQCPVVTEDGQLDFPEFGPVTTPWKQPSTLTGLGYTNDYGSIGLNKLVNTGQHVILFSNISALLNSIEAEIKNTHKWVDAVRHFDEELPKYLGMVKSNLVKLEIYGVALGCLMVVTNAAAYSAYEAAYKFHVAEIEYNKSQTK